MEGSHDISIAQFSPTQLQSNTKMQKSLRRDDRALYLPVDSSFMQDSIAKKAAPLILSKKAGRELYIWSHFAGCEHVSDHCLLSSCRAAGVHDCACVREGK